MVLIFY